MYLHSEWCRHELVLLGGLSLLMSWSLLKSTLTFIAFFSPLFTHIWNLDVGEDSERGAGLGGEGPDSSWTETTSNCRVVIGTGLDFVCSILSSLRSHLKGVVKDTQIKCLCHLNLHITIIHPFVSHFVRNKTSSADGAIQ